MLILSLNSTAIIVVAGGDRNKLKKC